MGSENEDTTIAEATDVSEAELGAIDGLRVQAGGELTISSYASRPGVPANTSVDALFFKQQRPACASRVVGTIRNGCVVTDCRNTGFNHQANTAAGAITVRGGLYGLIGKPIPGSVSYSFDALPGPVPPANVAMFPPGQELTIVANGAATGLPAFRFSQFKLPTQVTLASPAPSNHAIGPLTINRAAGWPLTWTRGRAGDFVSVNVEVIEGPTVFGAILDPTRLRKIACLFPAEAGNALVPAGAFTGFPVGGDVKSMSAARQHVVVVESVSKTWKSITAAGVAPTVIEVTGTSAPGPVGLGTDVTFK